MLSYRHAFHAGNHADILKHLTWLGVISHLKQKTKPFVVFDTHAGAGEYPLSSEQALMNREFDSGIARLENLTPASALLNDYQTIVNPLWQAGIYPGSPVITTMAMRGQDTAHMMELHPTEFPALQKNMSEQNKQTPTSANVHLHYRDGFEALIALTPPTPNRGAVLIDPPYEQKSEYEKVTQSVDAMFRRWHNAQVVLWYPLLSDRAKDKVLACQTMINSVSKLGKTCFSAELTVAPNTYDAGMYGSGVCVVNPSWQLDEHLTQAMKEVCKAMGESTHFSLNWLKHENS
ncbi:23S rRNA (adenine(2030)-N(6))-methyltransferase RlmJ [Salinimonas chungwhensis]|uniref:23S rRNA (adenine(2030)-N(6))-methyltransferase RlmJ n=1 Tax=Salinimonas chungwhensis TaxID=265425 RepID=UPI00036380A8|nr:23S rRNA (adenine(2030)-N(6))-methyltransferase RlmJ [Salinimonas chungwhensis]